MNNNTFTNSEPQRPERLWENTKRYCANSRLYQDLKTHQERSQFLMERYQTVLSQVYGDNWQEQIIQEYGPYWDTFILRDAGQDLMAKYKDNH